MAASMTARFHCIFPFVRVIAGIVFAALLCLPGTPADAAKKPPAANPMVFSIVRASNPGCEPLCPEWIAAEGEITERSAKAFEAILKKARGRRLPILINSPGGEIGSAMRMGKLIRKNKMTVEVAVTKYFGCNPRDGKCKPKLGKNLYNGYATYYAALCNSACTFVLAGGVRRIASPGAGIGVHEPIHKNSTPIFSLTTTGKGDCLINRELDECVKAKKFLNNPRTNLKSPDVIGYDQMQYKNLFIDYFKFMGVQVEFFEFMIKISYSKIHYMTESELFHYKIITEYPVDEDLVWLGVCDNPEPPEYCILRKKN